MTTSSTDNPTTSDSDLRAVDLIGAFAGHDPTLVEAPVEIGGIALSANDMALMRAWNQLTFALYDSKFDCAVSDTFNSTTFDGLNKDLSERYLSDDPVFSFGISLLGDFKSTHHFGYGPGYHLFEFADFDCLILDEEILEDQTFREQVYNQRRASLFGAQTPSAPRRRAAQGADPAAYVHPYPEKMGRAGSQLITPNQRRIARLTRDGRQNISRRVPRLTRNERTTGPAVAGGWGAAHAFSPVWTPLTQDATESSAEFFDYELGGTAPVVLIDDMAVSRRGLPALSGALDMAGSAFRSARKLDQTLGLVSVSEKAHTDYQGLIFEADDPTMLAMESDAGDSYVSSIGYDMVVPSSSASTSTTGTSTTGLFGARLGQTGGGITATGAEIFSTRQAQRAVGHTDTSQLLRSNDGPVSLASEMRFDHAAHGHSGTDPVVYVELPDSDSDGPRLKNPLGSTVERSLQMSPMIAAGMRSVTMPLSSAVRLGDTIGTRRTGETIGTRRTGETIGTRRTGESLTQPTLTTTTVTPSFYQFAYDAESVFLQGFDEAALSGTHVEVRDGRVVRAVPADIAGERAMRVQRASQRAPMASPAAALLSRVLTATGQSQPVSAEGVETGSKRPLMVGESRLELGYPAVALTSEQTSDISRRLSSMQGIQPELLGALAGATEADLAMLPPVVRDLLGRHTQLAIAMTQAGSDAAGVVARLAALDGKESPGTRSMLLGQLASMGVDTPVLLQVLDESGRPGAAGETALTDAGHHLDALGLSTGSHVTLSQDRYFGDFAPSTVTVTDPTDLLKGLVGAGGQGRTSTLAYTAELGALLALDSAAAPTVGDSAMARTQALARKTGTAEQALAFGLQKASGGISGRGLQTDSAIAGQATLAWGGEDMTLISQDEDSGETDVARDATDRTRSFKTIGTRQTERTLDGLTTGRPVAQFVGGGFDFIYSVLDRVNGSFAGLDAGVMEALKSMAGRGGMEEQSMHPGLDMWPSEEMSFVSPGGDEPSRRDTANEIARLEHRVGVAETAFARLKSRSGGPKSAPRSFQSVDWSLVDTGATRAPGTSSDLGRLGAALTHQSEIPQADMAMVAPVVKVIAQQAQLKPRSEAVAGGDSGGAGGDAGSPGGAKAKQPDYEGLASKVLSRLERRWRFDKHRRGGH